jgi:hypothetical protein
MAKKFPSNPPHPERLCWGCDLYCPATDLRCGNGSDRTPHPSELWGEDWQAMDGGTPAENAASAPEDAGAAPLRQRHKNHPPPTQLRVAEIGE